MPKFKITYFDEPQLTFGYDQKALDPRDGLTLFGPFSKNKVTSAQIGIIGTYDGIKYFEEWLNVINLPVKGVENEIARPFFPGIEAAFDFNININNVPKIIVHDNLIQGFLKYEDSHQRVHNLVNLFTEKLINFKKEEDTQVQVWFVIIPDDIYKYGRPKSKIPKTAQNIRIGIKDRFLRRAPSFFDEVTKLQDAYKYQINFHNQLKAKLLNDFIITQIIKESTIGYHHIWDDKQKIENEKKFDSAKAWSLCTTLYYKCGGLPWKLNAVREGVCYIGLVYKKIDSDEKSKNACCAAQMFLDSGDGQVFRGNIGPWYNPEKGEFHLKYKSAYELIAKALNGYKAKHNNLTPNEIFIHAKTYFNDEEWSGFQDALENNVKLVGVRIREDNVFKLYRDRRYPVPRGLALISNLSKAYLWTRGFIPRLQTIIGLETPNPLSIEITKGDANINTVCSDILALTKLNYNTCIYGDGTPVTLKFSESIGEVLTAGPIETCGVLPFMHYI